LFRTNRGDISTSLSLKPYLFKAAKNRILNYYRSSAVRQAYAADFKVFAEQYETPATANLEVSELLESIDSYMSDLPDRCRMAFHLSRVEHVSIPDIAEKMSISRRTVENYITIAARHLKKKMGLLPR
jgi:RNA polymerase sigma factor (sigma-70 family)